jgi:phosphatidyl-myo-inositol dimannoside synthase
VSSELATAARSAPRLLLAVVRWNRSGGLEATTVEIAKTFRELGWNVDVVSVYDESPQTVEGITAEPLCPIGRLSRSVHHRGGWRLRLRALLTERRNNYDLIIIGHASLLFGVPLRRLDTPVWLWVYGIEVWGEELRTLAATIRSLDRIVSISEFTAQQVGRWSGSVPVSIVPCFVDESVFVPAASAEFVRRNEILICGRMSPLERYKGHEVLFRALRGAERLCGFKPSISVVGDGEDRPRLEELANQLGMADSIRFRGRLPLAQLVEAYQNCGVFAMPSYVEQRHTGRWTGEGFGIVYIEAAACGRPVIASREGGARETVVHGRTGLLVDPRSTESVADAIAMILRDSQLADSMGAAGRVMVTHRFSRRRFRDDLGGLVPRVISTAR